ncbi:MAG: hypothetical protein A2Y33_08680 [Spirochaetes bacterium GWF1_51_8]|nr:MAG: hypothetical protein A2Y33_08680 [Spirochaetes bacterium GWF1_51_8]
MKNFPVSLIVFVALITSCGGKTGGATNSQSPAPASVSGPAQTLYCWVDDANLRDAPDLNSKVLGKLKTGDSVTYSGEVSPNTTKLELRGIQFDAPWYKVTLKDNSQAWVYSAVLMDKTPQVEKYKGLVFIYTPEGEEENTSEDWGWFTAEVQDAALQAGLYVAWGNFNDMKSVRIGNDPDHPVDSVSLLKMVDKDEISQCGYVFYQNGKKPVFKTHDMTDNVLSAASEYFGFPVETIIGD